MKNLEDCLLGHIGRTNIKPNRGPNKLGSRLRLFGKNMKRVINLLIIRDVMVLIFRIGRRITNSCIYLILEVLVQNYHLDWTWHEDCDIIFKYDGKAWHGEIASPGNVGVIVESL